LWQLSRSRWQRVGIAQVTQGGHFAQNPIL
jgi:hypothetical protein